MAQGGDDGGLGGMMDRNAKTPEQRMQEELLGFQSEYLASLLPKNPPTKTNMSRPPGTPNAVAGSQLDPLMES